MSIELILLAVNINLVAFSAYLGNVTGQVLAMFVLTVAAAEAAVGLAILVTFFRNRGDIAVDDAPDEGLMDPDPRHVILPLLGALVAGLFGRGSARPPRWSSPPASCSSARSSAGRLQPVTWGGKPGPPRAGARLIHRARCLHWSLRLDGLSAVMLVVVTTVSSLVHLYSWGYMAEDPSKPFFAYLSLFTFAMLMLVSADTWSAVLRLGRRGPRQLPADRLLVLQAHSQRGRDQGVRRQPRRRLRLRARHLGTFLVFGTVSIPAILAAAPRMAGRPSASPASASAP